MFNKWFQWRRRTYEELATEHLDGVITPEGTRKLNQRIERSPELADELQEMAAVRDLLRSQPMTGPPRSFTLPLHYTADAPPASRAATAARPYPGLRWLQGATAAAAVVLVALVGATIVIAPTPAEPAQTTVSPADVSRTLSTPSGTLPPVSALKEPEQSFRATAGAAPETTSQEPESLTEVATGFAFDTPLDGEDAVSAGVPPQPAPSVRSRTTLEWAQLGVSLITGFLALAVVGLTWGTRIGRPARVD